MKKKLLDFSNENMETEVNTPKDEEVFNSADGGEVDNALYNEAMEAIEMLEETKERLEALNEEQKANIDLLETGEKNPNSTLDIRAGDTDETIADELMETMTQESYRIENMAGKLSLPSGESLINRFTVNKKHSVSKVHEVSKESLVLTDKERKNEYIKLYKNSAESIGEVIGNVSKAIWEAIKKFFMAIFDFTKGLFNRYNIYQKETIKLEKEFKDHIRKVKPITEKNEFWEVFEKDHSVSGYVHLSDSSLYSKSSTLYSKIGSIVYLDIEDIRLLSNNVEKAYMGNKFYFQKLFEDDTYQFLRPLDPNMKIQDNFNEIKFTRLNKTFLTHQPVNTTDKIALIPGSSSNLSYIISLDKNEYGYFLKRVQDSQKDNVFWTAAITGDSFDRKQIWKEGSDEIRKCFIYYIFENRDLLNSRMLSFFKETINCYSLYDKEKKLNEKFFKNLEELKKKVERMELNPDSEKSLPSTEIDTIKDSITNGLRTFGIVYKDLCTVPLIYSKVIQNIFSIIKVVDTQNEKESLKYEKIISSFKK